MAKPGTKAGKSGDPQTRDQIIEAVLRTLREKGFAAATTRAIAEAGGFNPALISYYFGGLHNLFLAALQQSSRARLDRYAGILSESESLSGLAAACRTAFEEDFASGHISVLAELVGASSSYPDLRAGLIREVNPWVKLVEQAITRFLGASPLGLPAKQIAFAFVAFFLGIETLAHLQPKSFDVKRLINTIDPILSVLQFLPVQSEATT
jgi:AcrR family transcriptional regulator